MQEIEASGGENTQEPHEQSGPLTHAEVIRRAGEGGRDLSDEDHAEYKRLREGSTEAGARKSADGDADEGGAT
jgi:hypothetical protein